MAIQTRRGNEVDFDASKMLPGEWAVSLDTKYVRMCFSPGLVYRMATYESFEEDMIQIQQILATCEDIQTAVEAFEELAQQHANDAAASATESANSAAVAEGYANNAADSADMADYNARMAKSWAVGGEGLRPDESSNSAKYWCEQASAIANIDIATDSAVGIVKGNSDEINIDAGGQMSINSSFTEQEMLTDITGAEDKKTLFGKIAKAVSDLIAHIANSAIHHTLTNNLIATVAGTALDATQGKILNDKITTNTTDIATLNQNLTNKSGLTANSYTGSQTVVKDVVPDSSTFSTAQFVSAVQISINPNARACYAFHNSGMNGGTLFLDADGTLKFITNSGNLFRINMTPT